MAHITFFNVPAHGHVNPTLPVVRELVRQGHGVIYYDTAEFGDKIAPTGATFRPYPEPSPSSAEISALLGDGNMANITRLLLRMSDQIMPFVLDELRRDRPDVAIYDSIALWGYMGARMLGLPSVASFTHFILDGTAMKPSLGELWFMLRKALPVLQEGLRLWRRLVQRYGRDIFQKDHLLPVRGDLNIVFTAESLQPLSTWIDDSFRFVGPSIDPSMREMSAFDSGSLGDEALIYVSLGTVHSTNTGFYQRVFDAFADYPARFVLSTGKHTGVAALGPIPSNFIAHGHVPQLDVLQRASVFITHGGMNSVHEGLYYGVPLVVVPHQIEQAFNARVVESSGAGVILGGGPPFGQVTSAELRTAVEQMLVDDQFARRAQTIGERLRAAGGYRRAADEIVTFARQAANANENLIVGG